MFRIISPQHNVGSTQKMDQVVTLHPMVVQFYVPQFTQHISVSALYGYPPPSITLGSPPRSNIEAVNIILWDRHRALIQLKVRLLRAQDRMKKFADTNRTERSFVVGDWVYIRLQPYRQVSISNSRNHKLNLCFYGPFEIEERVGSSCVFRLVLQSIQSFMFLNWRYTFLGAKLSHFICQLLLLMDFYAFTQNPSWVAELLSTIM
jgi:hypothetical protein